eukprot:468178-Hanusia_phi.AAC.3
MMMQKTSSSLPEKVGSYNQTHPEDFPFIKTWRLDGSEADGTCEEIGRKSVGSRRKENEEEVEEEEERRRR